MRRVPVVLALFALAAASSSADQAGNDAGTGVDASNDPAAPTSLGFGLYEGNLTRRDADWYRVTDASSSPRCLAYAVGGPRKVNVTAGAVSIDGTALLTRSRYDNGSAWGGFARSSGSGLLLGVEPADNDPFAGDPARPGPYTFRLEARNLSDFGPGDGGGPDVSIPMPGPVPGPCIKGRLLPLPLVGDHEDAYAFSGTAGDVVTLSLAYGGDASLRLRLVGPTGVVLEALGSNALAAAALPEAGSYQVQVAFLGLVGAPLDYLVGFASDPPGDGCEPGCLLLGGS